MEEEEEENGTVKSSRQGALAVVYLERQASLATGGWPEGDRQHFEG